MKENLKITYSLITGSSKGIGKCLAYECARRNMNLILVARSDAGLISIADEIKKNFNVSVLTFATDLTRPDSGKQLHEWCSQKGLNINMLINNAGVGYEGEFEKLSPEFCERLMQLNMQSMVMLTRLFIPDLQKNAKAFILNVSSMAGFSPIPYKSVYAASKSFVLCFTRSLRGELRDKGISVSVLCPGPVPTNDTIKKSIALHGSFARLMVKQPEEVGATAIKNLLSGKAIIVPGTAAKVFVFIMKSIPHRIKQIILEKYYRQVVAHYNFHVRDQ